MKFPGKFGDDKTLSPEERLVEMERKYSVIIDRIQAYDKVLLEFGDIKGKISSLSSGFETAKESMGSLASSCSSTYNLALKSSVDSKTDIRSLDIKLDSLAPEFDKLREDDQVNFGRLKKWLAEVDEKHTEAQSSFVHPEELTELNASLQNSIRSSLQQIESLTDKIRYLSSIQSSIEEKHSELREDHNLLSSMVQEVKKSATDQSKESDYGMRSLRSFVEESVMKVKDQVVNYMNDTKIEMIGSPASMESVRKEILNKLNMTMLDGSNAVLKSSNNEQQIKILEKKLENLSMLMKKNEFSKMG